MNGTAPPPASPITIPPPEDGDLQSHSRLNSYLAAVASAVAVHTDARLVGIYLVDSATGRLALRAWTDGERLFGPGSPVPPELGRRGIDGDDLTAATLRDYMHAAPKGQRIASPIHDGEQWTGTVVGLHSGDFPDHAPTAFHEVASQLNAVLRAAAAPIGDHIVAEPEEALELPSDAILGTAAGGGVAAGPALLYGTTAVRGTTTDKVEEDREQALERLDTAVAKTCDDLEYLLGDSANEFYDVVSLVFSAHLLMIKDESFSGAIRSLVEAGQTPEDAVQSVVASFVRTFRGLREARLAEKAQDVQDIGQRILEHLKPNPDREEQLAGNIAIVQEVLPSDLVRLAMGHAAGVVLLGSTVTAHISILAQSLGLPVVFTSDLRILEIASQTPLLLDADEGALLISPTPEQLLDHGVGAQPPATAARVVAVADREAGDAGTGHRGSTMEVYANVNLLSDARRGAQAAAAGIGLYRSEFPFIIRNDYVSEDEQYQVYRSIVSSMRDLPVTLRTADIGGDKLLAGREEERNPFLGVRGIRFSLANRELFQEQLRAMLRAGEGSDLRIMFPMVSSVEEITDAREELALSMKELESRGVAYHRSPKIGAMIELPSAVVSIEDLAEECDFLSIGTNDLIMYLLAVDRTNERLSQLYRSHHPVVLRTIADVAKRVGPMLNELSVCGEAAADPLMIPFFCGIGIRKLSVTPRQIARVRETAGRYTPELSRSFAGEILQIRSLREMDRFLKEYAAPAS